jgi:hypothetical protein
MILRTVLRAIPKTREITCFDTPHSCAPAIRCLGAESNSILRRLLPVISCKGVRGIGGDECKREV